ncbi:MAG: hypothetical protein FJX75_04675 [Armatimonadetes bacterium]|nr:hypothetical protein [Armatimonadota bacterium]
MKMAQVEPTAGILLVADNAHPAHACCWARVAYANECGVNCNLGTRDIDRNARHNGGSSIGYCDGHGKWQSAGAIRTAGQSLFRQGW